MKQYLVWASAFFGFLAAILWLYASVKKVAVDPNDTNFLISETHGDKQVDVLKTAKNQTRWNAYGAFAASIAAVCQAASLFLPE